MSLWTELQIYRYLNNPIGENNEMLPGAQTQGNQSARKPKATDGIPYLKNEHLTTDPKTAKVIAVRGDLENKFGPAVVLKVSMDGRMYFWTLRVNNPNYEILLAKFGPEENDWVGQEILVGLAKDDFTEKYFPHVTFRVKQSGKQPS